MEFIKIATATMLALGSFMQAKMPTSRLIGSWKVTDVHADFPATLSASEKMKAEIAFVKQEKQFKASPFVFHGNGELEVMNMSDHWEPSTNGRSFRIIIMKNEGLDADIVSLEKEKLVFVVNEHDIKETFTLVRNH